MYFVIMVVFLGLFLYCIRIVPEKNEYIVERLGRYHRTLQSGNNVIIPLIDRVVNKVSKKETVFDFPQYFVVTKDKSEAKIDFVIYFQVTDPVKYTYNAEKPMFALESLCIDMFKKIIAEKEFHEIEDSKDIINEDLRVRLNIETDFLGIKINRAELKKISILYESVNLK